MTFSAPMAGTQNIFGNAANISGTEGNWATLGTWTVPNNGTYTKGDASISSSLLPGTSTTTDNMTGQTIPMYDSYTPGPSIHLTGPNGVYFPDSMPFNAPYTVSLAHGTPNTQVWLKHIVQSIQTAQPQEDITSYLVLPNGGLVGTTDGAGNFTYSSIVPPSGGDHSLLFYEVNSGSPPFPDSDDGILSDAARQSHFGAVTFWADGDPTQGPPPTYSIVRRTKEQVAESIENLRSHIRAWIKDGHTFLAPLVVDGADMRAELAKIKPTSYLESDFLAAIESILSVSGIDDENPAENSVKEVTPKQN
jgi:hypothetical protein